MIERLHDDLTVVDSESGDVRSVHDLNDDGELPAEVVRVRNSSEMAKNTDMTLAEALALVETVENIAERMHTDDTGERAACERLGIPYEKYERALGVYYGVGVESTPKPKVASNESLGRQAILQYRATRRAGMSEAEAARYDAVSRAHDENLTPQVGRGRV